MSQVSRQCRNRQPAPCLHRADSLLCLLVFGFFFFGLFVLVWDFFCLFGVFLNLFLAFLEVGFLFVWLGFFCLEAHKPENFTGSARGRVVRKRLC